MRDRSLYNKLTRLNKKGKLSVPIILEEVETLISGYTTKLRARENEIRTLKRELEIKEKLGGIVFPWS